MTRSPCTKRQSRGRAASLWLTTYSGRGPERRAAASTPKDASSSGRWRRMPLVLRLARCFVFVHLFEREVDHDHLEILSSVCCASALNKIGNRDTGYTKRHIRHRPGPARPDTVGSTRAPSNGMPTQSQTNRGSSLASSSPALAVAHPGAPRVRVPRTCRRRCRISSVSLIAALSPPPFVRPLADAPSRGPTVARHALFLSRTCCLPPPRVQPRRHPYTTAPRPMTPPPPRRARSRRRAHDGALTLWTFWRQRPSQAECAWAPWTLPPPPPCWPRWPCQTG